MNKVEMGNGGSSFINLPEKIAAKKACINIKNNDQCCFLWSITACLHPASSHSDRVSSYPHPSTIFNCDGIDFPIKLKDIERFEMLNNVSVNVFSLQMVKNDDFIVVPSRICKSKIPQRHANLLLIQNIYNHIDDGKNAPIDAKIEYHYVYIKNLSRLVSKQLSKSKKNKFICDQCLNYFTTEEKLGKHIELCSNHEPCHIQFPEKSHVSFTNYRYKQRSPFVMYCDFESYLKPINDINLSCLKYQELKPISAGFFLKSSYEDIVPSYYESYTGVDCMEWFSNKLCEIADRLCKIINHVKPINSTGSHSRVVCHICEKTFKADDKIVMDHDHFTGVCRGWAHNSCNLNFKKSFIIPVVFHNLGGYDAHFLIKEIAKQGRVSLLPLNKEKYISFKKYDENTQIQFRFIDSLRFLNSSLENLASYLSLNQFIELKKQFFDYNDDAFKLLTKKGVFPYDYISSVDKLNDTCLPSIEKFYNKLNYEEISDEQYLHAQLIWSTFNCQSLKDYMMLYLKTDIMLLADVFEQFRNSCIKEYELDPIHFYTLPGYTFQCMLKTTKIKLEIIKDIDILLFIENGIRGGISQCSNRYSTANNKYMGPKFDVNEPEKYLLYLDVNNLYGWAMSQFLPYGGFKWTDTNIDITQIPDDAPEGYILEVDLEYPAEIHDKHKDLPFCAESRIPPGSKLPKLLTTLYHKKNYIVHYRTLKQALSHGLVLKKVHRVLQFKQSAWLKMYIDKNTHLRQTAKNNFEKNLFKLMVNAVYGKTIENVRKHREVKLVNKWYGRYGAMNLISSPFYKDRMIFGENLVAIELQKRLITIDKPIYVGMSVLDISKVCLYEFHYDYFQPNFKESILNYVDTDSLTYEVSNQNPYECIKRDCYTRFDTSDYPKGNPYGIPQVNKKVLGLMKDENNGKIMTDFVGLR
ncbi:uncharacterized protein LOC123317802 [Coccinella septempunctata]|uniref:uncharacterized protein LOC123317802 n=1 Tax=Coccinella septempunctata TaxID=41139 RepID=UPI001D091897|nr:uncharacterized protein LOC123317802 [Coccinella septempunctata]